MTSDLLQNREWLIQPDALHAMVATMQTFHDRGGQLPASAPTSELLSIEDGIGVVAINGPILRKPGIFSRLFLGATDSEEFGAALREAGGRADVKAVFLDIDSPGGTVIGTPELAAAVASLNESKLVYVFSSGLMCSAAYWIAAHRGRGVRNSSPRFPTRPGPHPGRKPATDHQAQTEPRKARRLRGSPERHPQDRRQGQIDAGLHLENGHRRGGV